MSCTISVVWVDYISATLGLRFVQGLSILNQWASHLVATSIVVSQLNLVQNLRFDICVVERSHEHGINQFYLTILTTDDVTLTLTANAVCADFDFVLLSLLLHPSASNVYLLPMRLSGLVTDVKPYSSRIHCACN